MIKIRKEHLPTILAATSTIIATVALVMVWQVRQGGPVVGNSGLAPEVRTNIIPTVQQELPDGTTASIPMLTLSGVVERVSDDSLTIKVAIANELNPSTTQEKTLTFSIDDTTDIQKQEIMVFPDGTRDFPRTSQGAVRDLSRGDAVEVVGEEDLLTTNRARLTIVRIPVTISPPENRGE